MPNDTPLFYQSRYHAWAYSTLENEDTLYTLPMGAKFQTIHAPIAGVSVLWSRTLFRVCTDTDKRTGKTFRAYASEHSEKYAECPVNDDFMVYRTQKAKTA